jgi:methionyl aminopeptidase
VILLKSPEEFALMHRASMIVAEILEELAAAVKPGITTEELDRLAEELTYGKGARPAFKGYKPHDVVYPKTLCVSVNEEIVHGIPSGRRLRPGDIVGLDFAWFTRTFMVTRRAPCRWAKYRMARSVCCASRARRSTRESSRRRSATE